MPALQVVKDKEKSIKVSGDNLKDFVGKPVFSRCCTCTLAPLFFYILLQILTFQR